MKAIQGYVKLYNIQKGIQNYEKRNKNLVNIFKINKNINSIPYYIISFIMDSNDGDYIRGSIRINEVDWKTLHPIFFLALLYLGNGYYGKSSHGNQWGDYYGHHFKRNKHGLSELADILRDDFNIMCYTSDGNCHSYVSFVIEYYDSQDKRYTVSFPSIDDLFNAEEEMISTIKEVIKDYKNINKIIH